VAVDLAPLAGQAPTGPVSDVAEQSTPHKARLNNTMGGDPPGMSNIIKISKNILSEFEGNNWAKDASGNVASQALDACLEKS
jgi:hypothetical protein